MDFSLTEEQQMLLESTRRCLADHLGREARREQMSSAAGHSPALWAQFAELGLLALQLPEAEGGLGGGGVEMLLVGQALGEALALEPYLSCAVLGARALGLCGSAAQRAAWLPGLARGERIVVLANEELAGSEGMQCAVTARVAGAGWRLTGELRAVYHAPLADILLVPAAIDGGGELGLFALAPDSPGVGLREFRSVDAQRAADVTLADAPLAAEARLGGDARHALMQLGAIGIAGLCAEVVGALDQTLDLTIDYLKTRVQFGGPIGRFQALQHRVAEMLVQVEQARSMAWLAAARCLSEDPEQRASDICAAKVVVGRVAHSVGQQAVQLHGGMGVADEGEISHYFKRLLAAELRFGSTDAHLGHYAATLLTA